MRERFADFKTWLKRKLCRHRNGSVYEEVRTAHFCKVYWSAMHCCRRCGEVLWVEASFSGNVFQVGLAVDEAIEVLGNTESGRPIPTQRSYR